MNPLVDGWYQVRLCIDFYVCIKLVVYIYSTNLICIGGSYYYTINHSTIVAFTVGALYQPGNGFKIIGGHTGKYYPIYYSLYYVVQFVLTVSFYYRLSSFESETYEQTWWIRLCSAWS